VALSVHLARMHARALGGACDGSDDEAGGDDAPGASDSDEDVLEWHPDTTRAFVMRGDDADGALFSAGVRAALGIRDAPAWRLRADVSAGAANARTRTGRMPHAALMLPMFDDEQQ
jgi:hypothetical protein